MAILQPTTRKPPTSNPLFPCFDTIEEVEAFACSRVPVSTSNEMYGILQTYQNTLLRQYHGGESTF